MESMAIPAAFLHNCVAITVALLLALVLRVRWLVSLIAWGVTFGAGYLWRDMGAEWMNAWIEYVRKPVMDGGLWHESASQNEIVGILIFWLLPLGLAYAVTLMCIAKIEH